MAKPRKQKRLSEGLWRLSNGNYLTDTRDQDDRRIRRTYKDREQARREHAKLMHEIHNGTYLNPNAEYATFAAFVEVFHERYTNPRTGKRPRTDGYEDHAKALLPFFGHIPVSDSVDPKHWRDAAAKFMAARKAEGYEAAAGRNLRALQTMLNFAVRLDYSSLTATPRVSRPLLRRTPADSRHP